MRKLIAVILGTVPIYIFLIWSNITRGNNYTLPDLLLYPLLIGGVWIIWMLWLYRRLASKSIKDLNRSAGNWRRDIFSGFLLMLLMFLIFSIQQFTLNKWLPREAPPEAIITLISGLSKNPILLAIWLGPVVWIGVACFEEIQRVFMLDLLWDVFNKRYQTAIIILLSSLTFGFAHVYQGSASVAGISVQGVIYAVFYYKAGRLWPMIIAHGLFDSTQMAFAVISIRQAGL